MCKLISKWYKGSIKIIPKNRLGFISLATSMRSHMAFTPGRCTRDPCLRTYWPNAKEADENFNGFGWDVSKIVREPPIGWSNISDFKLVSIYT
jgi:hypothetical protein